MVKTRLNGAMFVVLVAALLSLQWTSRHVHMPLSHSHGDVQHKHVTVAHSHPSASHHEDVLDAGHTSDHYTVVEFNDDSTAVSGDKAGKLVVAVYPTSPLVLRVLPSSIPVPSDRTVTPAHGYLEQSNVRLRAPPLSA